MKYHICLLFICLQLADIFAQRVAINAVSNPADSSAILDISSSTKGILIPRMTLAERDLIADPATGFLIYQTDEAEGFYFYTGVTWSNLIQKENAWCLGGNSGTDPAVDFIGTTDNQPLRFRVNDVWAGEMHNSNENSFIGLNAGVSNTAGVKNSGFGVGVLSSNSTGEQNSAFGVSSLYSNTIGNYNSALGVNTLYNNTNGHSNTGVGHQALSFNTSGYWNTAIGAAALIENDYGFYNTAAGTLALGSNIGGFYNTAIGVEALNENTNGHNNTATGAKALFQNTTGHYNTATGVEALSHNTIGGNNTANGYLSLNFNSEGSLNTACGYLAMYSNLNGNSNTAIGYRALELNINGNYNSALGYSSGTGGGGWNNTISIGNNGYLNGYHDQAFIGNQSTMWTGGNTVWYTYSDARAKKEVQEDVKGLDFISRLRPVTYHRDIRTQTALTGNIETEDFEGKYDIEQIKFSGFLAQEVADAAIASGYDFSGVTTPRHDKELYTLSYEAFVVPLVKAVQEQQVIIAEQNKKISSFEQRLANMEILLQQNNK